MQEIQENKSFIEKVNTNYNHLKKTNKAELTIVLGFLLFVPLSIIGVQAYKIIVSRAEFNPLSWVITPSTPSYPEASPTTVVLPSQIPSPTTPQPTAPVPTRDQLPGFEKSISIKNGFIQHNFMTLFQRFVYQYDPEFTLEAGIKLKEGGADQKIFNFSGSEMVVSLNSQNRVVVKTSNNTRTATFVGEAITVNSWNHIAVSYKRTGTDQGTVGISTNGVTVTNLNMPFKSRGGIIQIGSGLKNAELDELRLSKANVFPLINGRYTIQLAPLTPTSSTYALFHFNGNLKNEVIEPTQRLEMAYLEMTGATEYLDNTFITLGYSTYSVPKLPDGVVNQKYERRIEVYDRNRATTLSLSIDPASLPRGISLQSCESYKDSLFQPPLNRMRCLLSGVPTVAGSYTVRAVLKDNYNNQLKRNFTLEILNTSVTAVPSQPQACAVPAIPQYFGPFSPTIPGAKAVAWGVVAGATKYQVSINDLSNYSFTAGSGGDVLSVVTSPAYTFNFQAGHSYSIWINSLNSSSGCNTYSPASPGVTVVVK